MGGSHAPGDRLGEFRLTRILGSGGMGQVFLGFSASGRPVAVKVVRPELATQGAFRVRFAREVEALRAVRGPCTANLVAADTDGDPPWAALEYVPGMTLADYVDTHGPLPSDQVQLLAWALAQALHDIHAAGVVHRDLKPSNVILGPGGPKVIDFGIAQEHDATSITEAGHQPGSVGWMAPEQLSGDRSSPATDIHGWASVVFFAATGTSPFGTGPGDAVAWRVAQSAADLDAFPSELAGLGEVLGAALAHDPGERPDTDRLLHACRIEVEATQTLIAPQVEVAAALASYWSIMASSVDLGRQVGFDDGRRRSRALRLVTVSGVAILALTAAGVGWFVVRDSDQQAGSNWAAVPGLASGAYRLRLPGTCTLSGQPGTVQVELRNGQAELVKDNARLSLIVSGSPLRGRFFANQGELTVVALRCDRNTSAPEHQLAVVDASGQPVAIDPATTPTPPAVDGQSSTDAELQLVDGNPTLLFFEPGASAQAARFRVALVQPGPVEPITQQPGAARP